MRLELASQVNRKMMEVDIYLMNHKKSVKDFQSQSLKLDLNNYDSIDGFLKAQGGVTKFQ
ncbi:MAG: hypothetical protein MTP17_00610 [Candidatus Midichloria sp.]|nr:MAG: hypothetical protein MTP17_00610 [Candidatus Midichloria sp.]